MNIDDLTLGQLKKIQSLVGGQESPAPHPAVGKYVIVRCRDAGVHAGFLVRAEGRSCTLSDSRRLWRWTPANNAKFLSGVATEGLDAANSKVGASVTVHLTEDCEILECTPRAEASLREVKADVNK